MGGDVVVTVPPGMLTLTAATTPVDLGALVADPEHPQLLTAGGVSLNPVTVTDTRESAPGYTVSGRADDLASGSGVLNAENLGWEPVVVSNRTGGPVTAGAMVPPGAGVPAGSVTGAGLRTARVLVRADGRSGTSGGSAGTVVVTARLTLTAPVTTSPGHYRTTVVITAI